MRHTIVFAAAVLALVSVEVGAQERKPDVARAALKNADGQTVGQATLEQTAQGVLIRAEFTDLQPGTRAFHIHEVGRCNPPDFESAGGHFNPTKRKHGFHATDGAHAGDLPNLHVPDTRRLTVEVLARDVSLSGDRAKGGLLDDKGTALVVHAGKDDYRSDPAGDAGDRLACGVIRR